jgi:ribonuclease P protein component
MTELLVTDVRRTLGERAIVPPIPAESLTVQRRSGRLPRHEEDLSTQEGEAEPDARIPEAVVEPGRAQRAQAAPRQGAQEARAERAQEVGAGRGVRLRKGSRLRLRREFLAVQERGRKLHSGEYLVLAGENRLGRPRLGVTVSSRVANAVGRNRVKRWVREAFRAVAGDWPGVDVVVIARAGAPSGGLAAARRALEEARARLAPRGA